MLPKRNTGPTYVSIEMAISPLFFLIIHPIWPFFREAFPLPDKFALPFESCNVTPDNDDMDESEDHKDHVGASSCFIFDQISAEGLDEMKDFQPDSKTNLGGFLHTSYVVPSYMRIDLEILPALPEFVIEEGASLLGLGLDRDLENAMSSSSRAGKQDHLN